MSRGEEKLIMGFFRIVVFMAIIAYMFFLSAQVWAQGDCRGNHPCPDINGGDVVTSVVGGDTAVSNAIGGSRAYGFGMGSTDVDINQCLASKSISVLIVQKQGVIQNLHCMGLAYVQAGNLEAARWVLCEVDGAPLKGMPNCPGEFFLPAPPVEPEPVAEEPIIEPMMYNQHVEEEAEHAEQLSELLAWKNQVERSSRQEAQRKASIKTEIAERFNVQN